MKLSSGTHSVLRCRVTRWPESRSRSPCGRFCPSNRTGGAGKETATAGGRGGQRYRRCVLTKAPVCPLRIRAFRLPLRLSLGAVWPRGSPSMSPSLRVSVCEAGRTSPSRQGPLRVTIRVASASVSLSGRSSWKQQTRCHHRGGGKRGFQLLAVASGMKPSSSRRGCLTALRL